MYILTQRGSRNQGKINVYVYMVSCLPVIFQSRTHISWKQKYTLLPQKNAGQKSGSWKKFHKQAVKIKTSNGFIHAHRGTYPRSRRTEGGKKWAFKDDMFKDPKYFIYTCIQKRILRCHFSTWIVPCKKNKSILKTVFKAESAATFAFGSNRSPELAWVHANIFK